MFHMSCTSHKKNKYFRVYSPLLCNGRINNGVMQPIVRQLIGKQVPAATNTHTTIELLFELRFLLGPCKVVIRKTIDSKIWSRVLRNSYPRMTALARTSSNCKRQTRSLVRESAPHQQTSNCLRVIKIWS
jgi:hypothetical protein